MSSIQVGVINWDSALPPDTFFGHYMARSLSPACYRDRVPYYADVVSDGTSLTFRARTAADFDRELQYAIDAGIDYFAYVWYGEEKLGELGYAPTAPTYVSDKVWELSALRKMHADSPLRDRIRLCAILSVHPFTDAELHRLAREMQQTYYQQYNGRPLAYLYSGYREDLILRLRAACRAEGTADPWLVFLDNGAPLNGTVPQAQGVCNYTCTAGGLHSYAELVQKNVETNASRQKYGVPVVPLFVAGWNPRPRLDHPVPWCSYPDVDYAPIPGPDELMEGAVALADWIRQTPQAQTGHILTFAWNEFEEGGFLCPTRGPDGRPDTRRLDGFAKAVAYWKNTL